VHAYSQFDAALCRGKGHLPHIPCRYPQPRDAYTHEATTSSRLATYKSDVDRNGHIVTHGRTPTPANVLGHNADLRRQGGQVLSGVEAEALESVLWDVADKVKRQRQNAQRGHSTRRDGRGDYHRGNQQSLNERVVDLPFGGGRSKHQYRGKLERPRAAIDEDRFSSNGVPVQYEPSGIAGPSRPPVVNKEEYLYEDEDGTYKEEVVGEEIPTDDGLVGDKPVEDEGKAADRAQPSLLAMW